MNFIDYLKKKGLKYTLNRCRIYTFRLFWINDIRILKLLNEKFLVRFCSIRYKKVTKKIINSSCDTVIQNKNEEKRFFTLWFQGEEKAPALVKRCFGQMRKIYGQRVVVITEETIKNYAEIPDYIYEKYKKGIISAAHFSDIVRTFVLLRNGGVWLDSTCFLTAPIPDTIINSNLFFFQTPKCHVGGIVCSSWFIVAKANEEILKILSELLKSYWSYHNHLLDYLQYHLFVASIVRNIGDRCDDWKNMPYYNNDTPHILGREMLTHYDRDRYNDILRQSFIHKLSNHYKEIPVNSYLDVIINERAL